MKTPRLLTPGTLCLFLFSGCSAFDQSAPNSALRMWIGLLVLPAITIFCIYLYVKNRAKREVIAGESPKPKLLRFLLPALLVLIGVIVVSVMKQTRSGPWANSGIPQRPGTVLDPNPVGTWIEGDRNSVYNRLVVNPAGTFSFQTLDFTGDVKGGYSGRWSMSGSRVQFEWGGIADHGGCSGYKSGANSLVFGATTFSR